MNSTSRPDRPAQRNIQNVRELCDYARMKPSLLQMQVTFGSTLRPTSLCAQRLVPFVFEAMAEIDILASSVGVPKPADKCNEKRRRHSAPAAVHSPRAQIQWTPTSSLVGTTISDGKHGCDHDDSRVYRRRASSTPEPLDELDSGSKLRIVKASDVDLTSMDAELDRRAIQKLKDASMWDKQMDNSDVKWSYCKDSEQFSIQPWPWIRSQGYRDSMSTRRTQMPPSELWWEAANEDPKKPELYGKQPAWYGYKWFDSDVYESRLRDHEIDWPLYNVMMVKWDGDIATRLGIGRCPVQAFDAVASEKQRFRLG